MKLVVALGNPGKTYDKTRHNIGFLFLDYYLKNKANDNYKSKFNALYTDAIINNEKVFFIKPQSYINLSGEVLKEFIDYYDIEKEDILIIHDDMDLEIASFKLKEQGSSAGHNGLKNIEKHLKSKEYKRLKIGISRNTKINSADYVLSKIPKESLDEFKELFKNLSDVLDDYFYLDFEKLMSKYNKKNL